MCERGLRQMANDANAPNGASELGEQAAQDYRVKRSRLSKALSPSALGLDRPRSAAAQNNLTRR